MRRIVGRAAEGGKGQARPTHRRLMVQGGRSRYRIKMTLDEEGARATELLRGLMVKRIVRHKKREVLIEFDDGSRLFADSEAALHLSIHHTDD